MFSVRFIQNYQISGLPGNPLMIFFVIKMLFPTRRRDMIHFSDLSSVNGVFLKLINSNVE